MEQQKMKEMNLVEVEDDLTPEQRAYWEASIERDLREIAEGKPQKYISLEQFGEELRASIRRRL
ncbi:MAG: hypothetical protein J6T56_08470 [Bacteroidales bacterium]|nr:hypothetical protein [Bacteroidales bacterium]MBP5612527.1 hypothetical protein [Bacteroidales bacterium]